MEHSDFDYALSLHYMLNGESAIENLTVIEPTEPIKDPNREESSDDEIVEEISIKKQKTKVDEFFVPSIKTWIDLQESSGDWTEIRLTKLNVQMIFDKMKKFYFDKWLANVKCSVKWDQADIITDGCNYKIFEGLLGYEVFISLNTLIRPRIQLISLLLHILIHLYITTSSKGKVFISHHGPEFRKLMHFFNSRIESKITTGHNFLYSAEEVHYPTHWWQCTGVCSNYQPFYGVIRSTSMPSEAMTFWSAHHSKCGGTYFKIFEAERHHGNGTVEKKYVRNVKYLNPRAKIEEEDHSSNTQKRNKATASQALQVRAQIDLTDEVPQEKNLCTVINLDESEFIVDDSDDEETSGGDECGQIITFCDNVMKNCFLCSEIVGESRLASHLDTCTGFQQQVAFDAAKLVKI